MSALPVERFGIVRLRQVVEDLRHRLTFLPVVVMLAAVVASQLTLAADRRLGDVDLPAPLETSLDNSRLILSTIAGGLITTVTLLLSMMLVAVQLASSNFSPRTLRNWLGDTTLRWSVAIVVGTIVFCLMGVRSVQIGPDAVDTPTVTVLVAVLLALVALVAVIRAVDHVASNMQVGTVAHRLVASTIRTLNDSHSPFAHQPPTPTPAGDRAVHGPLDPPEDAVVIESTKTGWVQQIDEETLTEALPEGAAVWISVAHGDYVISNAPLARLPADNAQGELDPEVVQRIRSAFALGQTRTMQQDVGFGLAQLSDIAVRALSPGINDPETAANVVLNLGEVLREVWSHDPIDETVQSNGRTIHRLVPTHEQILRAALDPVRRHAREDPAVLSTMARSIRELRAEVERCGLPGPTPALDRFLQELWDTAVTDTWLQRERAELRRLTRSAEAVAVA